MKNVVRGRRHPRAFFALLLLGLFATGCIYSMVTAINNAQAQSPTYSAEDIAEGKKLFLANCASCHGMNAQGTKDSKGKATAPSLIGVGAASSDFQLKTGRMPMQAQGPQAERKRPQFNDKQIHQLNGFIASLGPGPGIPDSRFLDTNKGNAAKGGEIFRINCAMCHNAAGAGGALTEGKFAPTLKGVSEKEIYEAMLTGPQNMPVFNDANISPESKQDIITYLKMIEANGSPGGADLGSLGPVSEGLFLWVAGLGVIIVFTIWLTSRAS